MFKISAVLISVAVLASSFTSAAQAGPGRRLGFFFGGMAAASMLAHAAEERRREQAYERERARRQMIAARERAAAAAAAKRERARQLALQQQKAAQIAAAETTSPVTPEADKPILKKGDRLPSADNDQPATDNTAKITTAEKTSPDNVEASSTTPGTDTVAADQTCRRYSAATDSLIETPCH
ncbi:hypothetical protein [Hyphomicrobium facile]|uniref:Uncharacterized protein n=1 Tax=Hyphomicrobium facile TaxID=51670 RepID=A0A1I7N348_9HYPH|nr:hypothetical protein [Hyphomicrobium facile]SFV29101.1 hypothetical protein SAMN04488557_1169 [Hyphomicrobium facile]